MNSIQITYQFGRAYYRWPVGPGQLAGMSIQSPEKWTPADRGQQESQTLLLLEQLGGPAEWTRDFHMIRDELSEIWGHVEVVG